MPAVKTPVTMPAEFIAFAPPALGPEEIREVVDTLQSPWITTGPKTHRFEQEFREAFDAHAALAVNSCTAALHTALIAHGIGAGDEVITTTLTFVATANVIEHVGARPVLVDVDPVTLTIDPEKVAAAVTPRTKAVIAVHYAGHPADLDALQAICQAHHLVLIEDAAHALPAHYRGRPIGSGTNPTAFSFYATKNMTTAEGGMLTGTADFVAEARMISLHGMSHDAWKRYDKKGTWKYDVLMPGFKYNMTDVQASLGLWQLRKLRGFHRRREEIAAQYSAAFADEEGIEVPVALPHVGHAWHLYVALLRPGYLTIGRDEFIELLRERNVGASVHFIPVHEHRFYRQKYDHEAEDFPVAHDRFTRMLSLPLHPRLSDDNVADVCGVVRDLLHSHRR